MIFPPLPHLPLQHSPEYYMSLALEQACKAAILGEIPVGACLVIPKNQFNLNEETKKNEETEEVVLKHNQPILLHDPTAHAEIQALRHAGKIQHNYRLYESVLFVTLEPCVMCFGAIINARVKHVYFATSEPKKGVYHSCLHLFHHKQLNPHFNTSVSHGLLERESREILQAFFQARRTNKQ